MIRSIYTIPYFQNWQKKCTLPSCRYSDNLWCIANSGANVVAFCYFEVNLVILFFKKSLSCFCERINNIRAGTGFSHPGVYAVAIVLGTEVVGSHYRRIVAVGTATAVAIGEACLFMI